VSLSKVLPQFSSDCSGRGRGDGENGRFGRGSYHLVFIGGEAGRLVSYKGPFEDARLQNYHCYQLTSATVLSSNRGGNNDFTTPEHLKSVLQNALHPDARCKMQIGRHLVYFGCEGGGELSTNMETLLACGVVDAARIREITDGPHRTSFVSLTFSDITLVVECLQRHLTVVTEKVTHSLRATEKTASASKQFFYERSAETRAAVFDQMAFTTEAFFCEQRCLNLIVVPPTTTPTCSAYALSPALQCQAVGQTQPAGRSRRLQVKANDGRVTVALLGDSGFANYLRLEERHVIKTADGPGEFHATKVGEYGADVAEKEKQVRVELRNVVQQGDAAQRLHAWEAFVRQSLSLRQLLAQPTTLDACGANVDAAMTWFCMGDSSVSPCSSPSCNLRHRHMTCFDAAFRGCNEAACHYWHGFTEAQALLRLRNVDYVVDPADFQATYLSPLLVGRLRAALSMQLHRICEAVTCQLMDSDADSNSYAEGSLAVDRLVELVKQYNTVAHSFNGSYAKDASFFYRCCQWLKAPLPLLAAWDEVRAFWLKGEGYLLLVSYTGSGKSTQLPQYLAGCAAVQLMYDHMSDFSVDRKKLVICVVPRALAAETLVKYVASESDEPKSEATDMGPIFNEPVSTDRAELPHCIHNAARFCRADARKAD
jgi:hypothetical protein